MHNEHQNPAGAPDDHAGQTRAGFVAIVGAPNAGKSTLVNALVGEKVTIVTHKIQTTRFQLRGIAMDGDAQLVLIDTPGIFQPKGRLDRSMVHSAWSGASDADVVVHVVDAPSLHKVLTGDEPTSQDKLAAKDAARVQQGLARQSLGKPVYLALNKIDLIERPHLLALIEKYKETGIYKDIFLISALTNDGVFDMLGTLSAHMPKGPWLYPADQAADIPARLIAAEITREKLFLRLHDELPYASHVETESWKSRKDGSVRIEQIIYVKRDSQKPIVLGKGGKTIKQIGQMAREEMQETFEMKVHLFLFVKVRENWSENRAHYEESGLEFDV